MPSSIWAPEVQAVLADAESMRPKRVQVGDRFREVPTPFPSPADWRDQLIYFLLIDRFHNPVAAPAHRPWDEEYDGFQGGTFNGVRAQLDYLQQLGVGALWLSPVVKNCQYEASTYHGYGAQDFLQLDPRLASNPGAARANPQLAEDELRALVDEAHARDMYIIFDIVLNHAGDIFEYAGYGSAAPWRDSPYEIRWRDADGSGRPDWTEAPQNPPADAAVWPSELCRNELFRRQGRGGEAGGDFESLKELVTGSSTVRDTLIRTYQYLIAKYDIDGFRIDTLKYIEPQFARIFGNAIREFALSIGKRNFFTFGEVYDDEEKIARFIGRNTLEAGDLIGVDAALDFPLFYKLPDVTKGLTSPAEVINVFEHRKQVQRNIISSHGETSKFFVTFLDNHDQHRRFYYRDPADPQRFDGQLTLGLTCLVSLQGIPCLYYGTEQGLAGQGRTLEAVREALWGRPKAFDPGHPFYQTIQHLTTLRKNQPALRYGRQYFRPLSGDGVHFGISRFPGGVLAFSRILNDREMVVVANTNAHDSWTGDILLDFALNPDGSRYRVLFSNQQQPAAPRPVVTSPGPGGSLEIREVDGTVTYGPARILRVSLQPMEVQILGRV